MSIHRGVCIFLKGTHAIWSPHCAPCSISLPPFTFSAMTAKSLPATCILLSPQRQLRRAFSWETHLWVEQMAPTH